MWRWLPILMLPLAAHANDIMWTGKGEVTQGNSHFGVGARDPIDIVVRYAPEDKVTHTTTADNGYVAQRIYHGNIRLRIELRSGAKAWISYHSSTSFFGGTPNNNVFDVFSAAPSAPAPAPGGVGGDMITLRANSANSATFERFHQNSQFQAKGILLRFGDFTRTYDLLSLKQFPGKNLPKHHLNAFEGAIYAGNSTNQFTFRIDPATLTLGEYIPPLHLAIKRNSDGTFGLTFNAQQGVMYEVQATQDFSFWMPVGYHVGVKDGDQTVPAPTHAGRFFRMRRVPTQ